jgi:hypothetical protein
MELGERRGDRGECCPDGGLCLMGIGAEIETTTIINLINYIF